MKLFGKKPGRGFKSILPLCLVLILAAGLTVGGTLAFLQAQSGTVTNSFTAGEITYTLNLEPNAQDANQNYADTVVKMPVVQGKQTDTDLSVDFKLTATGNMTSHTPELSGYNFEGWYYDDKCETPYTDVSHDTITVKYGDKLDSDPAPNKVEITLYAKWEPITYTVKYNANGGTGNMADSTHTYDVAQALNENTYTRTGYEFLGWSTERMAVAATYTDMQEVTNLADEDSAVVELYAVWKQMNFTVSFDTQAKDVANPASKTVTYQMPYGELPTVTRTGYTFLGWTLEKNSIDYITKDSVVNTAQNHMLYAQWKINTYTVKFDANGGSGTMADQTFTYGEKDYLSANAFSYPGYQFIGWAVNASSSTADYTDKQYVSNLTDKNEITLYAVWSAGQIVVTFDSGYADAPANPSQKIVTYREKYGELAAASIEGYKFLGWYTLREGGTQVTADTIVNNTENHTLYAHWQTPDIDLLLMFEGSGTNNFTTFTKHDYEFGTAVTYTGQTWNGKWESFSIRMTNLVVGGTYQLKFDAEFSDRTCIRDTTNYPIGCKVDDHQHYAESESTEEYVWKPTDNNKSVKGYVIEFVATKDTMYWLWELSKIRNPAETYGSWKEGVENFEESYFDLTLDNVSLTLIDAYIDFEETAARTTNNDGDSVGTFKINYYDEDSVNFNYKGAGGLYEKVRIPINGLISGNMYTVDYTFTPGTTATYKSFITETKTMSNNYTNTGTQVYNQELSANQTINGSFSFKATASTMYWLWDMTRIPNNNEQAYHFNATIKLDQSATPTVLLPEELAETNEITFLYDGIDNTFIDAWYPIGIQSPTAGVDYVLAFEPMEGYTMAEIIVVNIDGVNFIVNTDGSTVDGYVAPVYNPAANILIIPGALLTTQTQNVAVIAAAVPVVVTIPPTTEVPDTTIPETTVPESTTTVPTEPESTTTVPTTAVSTAPETTVPPETTADQEVDGE